MSIYLGDTPLANNAVSRNIGEIIQSTIPLSDAGLHLLDGALINGTGSYSAFYEYIVSLYSSYPQLYTDEAGWQQSVANYGVCGKFVFNTTNRTVRLPKITGFTEGTIDPTVLGDLTEAGLPNITGRFGAWESNNSHKIADEGPFTTTSTGGGEQNGNGTWNTTTMNLSRANPIYGNSSTVQPQSIKVLYYIVIATSTKTSIEVDIDEVMTDLNGKADVDLSNSSVPHIVETYVNGTSWYRVWSADSTGNRWCEQGGMTDVLASNVVKTITLLKAMSNTNYTITACERYDNGTSDNNNENYWVSAVSTESFGVYNSAGGYKKLYWIVSGYKA